MTEADMNAKTRAEELNRKRSTLAAEISDVQAKIAMARNSHEDKIRQLQEKLIEADAEVIKLQAEIAREEGQRYASEFFRLAKELDVEGESPARLAQWKNLHCQLRTARLIGQSFAMCDQVTERLRSLPGARPLPVDMQTWSAVAKMWVKERVAA
jgi:hypothetical protein